MARRHDGFQHDQALSQKIFRTQERVHQLGILFTKLSNDSVVHEQCWFRSPNLVIFVASDVTEAMEA